MGEGDARASWSAIQFLGALVIILVLILTIILSSGGNLTASVYFDPGDLITAILALAAVYTVYLSYKYRPTMIEVIKDHTASLRGIAKAWEDSLPGEDQLPLLPAIDGLILKELRVDTGIEKRHLFPDLTQNHLPPELDIMKTWSDVKLHAERMGVMGAMIETSLLNQIVDQTRLTYSPSVLEDGYFTNDLLKYVVSKKVELHNLPMSKFEACKREGRNIVVTGTTMAKAMDEEHAVEVMNVIDRLTRSDEFIQDILDVVACYAKYRKSVLNLRIKLEDLRAISLLPGTCKFMQSP